MKRKTKVISAILAVAAALTLSGCADTSVPLTIGGRDIPAGEYIFAQLTSLPEARMKFTELYPDVDTGGETFDYFTYTMEDKSYRDWINQNAIELLKLQAAYEIEFDALGLQLDQEMVSDTRKSLKESWDHNNKEYFQYFGRAQISEEEAQYNYFGISSDNSVNAYIRQFQVSESTWGKFYENRGVSFNSFLNTELVRYKPEMVFMAYYDEGGLEPVPEDELMEKFTADYVRANVLELKKTDVNDEEMTDEELARLKVRAEGYKNTLNDTELDEITAFATIQDDYQRFIDAEDRRLNPELYEDEVDEEILEGDETPSDGGEVAAATEEVPVEGGEGEPQITVEEGGLLDSTDVSKVFGRASTDYDEEVINQMFDLSNGEATFVETDTAYVVIQRLDISARTDWFDQARPTLLSELKMEEFQSRMEEKAAALEVVTNEAALKRYDPKKLLK